MTLEERLKATLGGQVWNIVALQTQLEAVSAELKDAKAKADDAVALRAELDAALTALAEAKPNAR